MAIQGCGHIKVGKAWAACWEFGFPLLSVLSSQLIKDAALLLLQ